MDEKSNAVEVGGMTCGMELRKSRRDADDGRAFVWLIVQTLVSLMKQEHEEQCYRSCGLLLVSKRCSNRHLQELRL